MTRTIGFCVLAALAWGCESPPGADRPRAPREPWATAEMWKDAANQPLPPGVVRVKIERYEVDERDRQAIEAAIRYRDEQVDVSAGGLTGRNGLMIFAAESGVSGALRVRDDSRYTRRSSSQFLLLNEGTRGSLQMIEQSYRPWRVVVPVWRGAVVVRTIRAEVTGTGMFVTVSKATPGAVTVRLTPYFDRRRAAGRENGRIVINELQTTLTVVPGRPYVIMQDQRHDHALARGLLSHRSDEAHAQVIVVLTVDVGG